MRSSDWSSDVCSSDLPALARALDRLLAFDPYARLGEVEGVHQLRVAGRRLRSVLRTFAPLLDEQRMNEAHDGLRWLGQAMGKIGRASCRERVGQDVSISVVAVSLKKKKQ